MTREQCIAYFISPHGYGHAARAAAVMAALAELQPGVQFEIFTQAPDWLFRDSRIGTFRYHSLLTDIGLVQKTSLVEDLVETVRCLQDFLPFNQSQVEGLVRLVNEWQCRLVICDIAPLGIAVARQAGLPTVLIENFTWDWVYQSYADVETGLKPYISYLQEFFTSADYHIQAEPVCMPQPADLTTGPISRKSRILAEQTRQQLGLPDLAKVVLITMGGTPWHYTFFEQLVKQSDFYFVISGAKVERWQSHDNLVLLPYQSGFFHPDLIHACDAVIGKVGYSTLAEVYYAGIPFGYIGRTKFPESPVLAAYIQNEMRGMAITETQFQSGEWLLKLPELLALPRLCPSGPDGASQAADFIRKLLAQDLWNGRILS